jgi:23S rRNA pseudouridine1911/1915/1917 synthase
MSDPQSPTHDGARQRIAFVLDETAAGERLDKALAARPETAAAGFSRARLQALIEAGAVVVDGVVASDLRAKAKAGMAVAIEAPTPEPAEPVGQPIPLDIVFEDAHLLVIDKPAGLVVHPAAGHADGTLVNALIAHCGDSLSGIGGVRRPGIVHRLDKDTSGLMVVAKTDLAHQGLSALFADHGRELSLTRQYRAVVWGAPERPQGTIVTDIGRHPRHRDRQAALPEGRGKEAITHWRRLARYGGERPVAALVECALETGRTHQIRVHMAHVGHPLLGDPLYGTGFRTKAKLLPQGARAALDALGRQALHAATLGFAHPVTGEEMLFESPIPADMAALIAALEQS